MEQKVYENSHIDKIISDDWEDPEVKYILYSISILEINKNQSVVNWWGMARNEKWDS